MNSVEHDFENLRLAFENLKVAILAEQPCRFFMKVVGWIEDHL